ncbi:MAG: hypothetical protein QOD88_4385, partial [Mycobacterium sp.]|nr:hypothetical protein [Mycobacterium sp.]
RNPPLPNQGMEKAEKAAEAAGATVLLAPELPERAIAGMGTDWNDYAALRGTEAVQAAIGAQIGRRPHRVLSRSNRPPLRKVWEHIHTNIHVNRPVGVVIRCCPQIPVIRLTAGTGRNRNGGFRAHMQDCRPFARQDGIGRFRPKGSPLPRQPNRPRLARLSPSAPSAIAGRASGRLDARDPAAVVEQAFLQFLVLR